MESEPTDGKDVQAEASAPISESQTEALDTEAELSKLTPELQAKFKQLLAQETKHLSERTDSTGSVKEPPPKQQKIEVDDDFQAFLSFLPEIDLEWGDLDPNVQQKLRYSQQAREDFKALHHQKQEINTYDPETGHITTTQPKKRPFEEQYKPPEIEAADKQLQQAMMQYHRHQVLPGLQHLTECCQNFYGTVSQEILLLQHMTDRHSLQLRSLEQSRCNKTILLKNLPPVGFTKTQLDRNLQYLLNDANLTWDRLAAMHNHVVTTDAAVLRLEFLTEEDAKIFFQAMKRRKHHWFFNGQQEAKIRVEHDQPVEDRLALQPFYALIDMLSPHFGNDGTNALQMDKNTLQVWPGSEHQDQTMLAQVSYHLDPHVILCKLCLCALGASRLCQQCWDNDLPSDFDQKQEIQSYPLYCPGKKGNSACNQLLGFGNCPLCIEHRNYWKSKAAQSVHPGFSPFQKAAHLVLDRALHDLDLVSADSEIKTDWLDDMRLAYDQDDQSGNYHFAEWVLMTYADLEGFENLLQSGRQPYCFPDWGAPGQLPSHGIYFGDKEQPLLMQTFWSAHYFGALLQKYYGQNWQRIVPGYTAEFFQAFDIRFAALLPWDYMVAASFRIALIQESEARRDRSTEPIPGQWHMDNVEWLVQEVLEGIPRNQDVIDYVASKWAEIISEDDLLFDLFVGNQF